MANEFIARNGLISLSDSAVSGSVRIYGGVTSSRGIQVLGGTVIINTVTDTGLYNLDVNGPARLQGKLTISTGGTDIIGNSTVTGSLGVTAGVTASLQGTATNATTASFASNADLLDGFHASVFAQTGSNTFVGNQTITGWISASAGLTGSHLGTSSYAVQALSASYAATASVLLGSVVSASYAATASVATTASYSNTTTSASFASTASYVSLIAGPNITIAYKTAGIEISGSTGGSGTPGGSNTQIQYNNATAFGGVPTLIYDGSTLRGTGSFSGSFKGDGSGLTGVVASATPAGPVTSVQFNDSGTTSGSANFLFSKALNEVIITGSIALKSSAMGSNILDISSSNGTSILAVNDNTASSANILTVSSASITFLNIDSQGSTTGSFLTNALYYGVLAATVSADQNDYSPAGWDSTNPSKKTIISISGSTSVKITGLAGGIDGRLVVFQNDSPDFIILLEDQSASSQAANRFDLHNSVFLLPNDSITFLYDAHSSRWEPVGASTAIEYGAYFDTFEDFLGDIGRWGSIASGTGASTQISTYLQNTTEKPIGIWQADTGTTATGRAQIGSTQVNSIFPAAGQAVFLSRVALEQTSSTSNRFAASVGWHNAAGGNVSNGMYWRYTDANSNTWQAVAQSASFTVSSSINGPTVDTNYIWLGGYANSGWTRVTYFYSTDSTTWNITGVISGSNILTTNSTASFGAAINKTVGNAQANLSVDLLAHRYDITRG